MDIDTALKYMTIEKAIELEKRRFFCNADETINTIAIHCMRKQIPMKVEEIHVDEYICPACGNKNVCGDGPGMIGDRYCPVCGQAIYQEN